MEIKEYTSRVTLQALLWTNDNSIKMQELDDWAEGKAEFERKNKEIIIIHNNWGYKNSYEVKAPCYIVKGKYEMMPLSIPNFNRSYQEVKDGN